MKRVFFLLVVLVIGVVALGYYRDWFGISTASDNKAIDIHVTVDKEKVKEDEEKAKEKLGEVRDRIKEKAGEATSKDKKGSGNSPDKPE